MEKNRIGVVDIVLENVAVAAVIKGFESVDVYKTNAKLLVLNGFKSTRGRHYRDEPLVCARTH